MFDFSPQCLIFLLKFSRVLVRCFQTRPPVPPSTRPSCVCWYCSIVSGRKMRYRPNFGRSPPAMVRNTRRVRHEGTPIVLSDIPGEGLVRWSSGFFLEPDSASSMTRRARSVKRHRLSSHLLSLSPHDTLSRVFIQTGWCTGQAPRLPLLPVSLTPPPPSARTRHITPLNDATCHLVAANVSVHSNVCLLHLSGSSNAVSIGPLDSRVYR